jgi:hypothetical protein
MLRDREARVAARPPGPPELAARQVAVRDAAVGAQAVRVHDAGVRALAAAAVLRPHADGVAARARGQLTM